MLHVLKQDPSMDIGGLLTTMNEQFDRVAMHAVRRRLLEAQAEAAGIPLRTVPLPWPCTNERYEERMRAAVSQARRRRLHARGLRRPLPRRRAEVSRGEACGHRAHAALPHLGHPDRSSSPARWSTSGLRSVLTCVNPKHLDRSFAGRQFDRALLDDLPAGVDKCGERGEFHSFAWDGPMFNHPVPISVGEVVDRDGFVFADVS